MKFILPSMRLRGMPAAAAATTETSSKKNLKRTQAQKYKSRDAHEMLLRGSGTDLG